MRKRRRPGRFLSGGIASAGSGTKIDFAPYEACWILRLMVRAELWKRVSSSDLTNSDDLAVCSWFEAFRSDVNWAIAYYLNEAYFRTGRPKQAVWELSCGSLVHPDSEDESKVTAPLGAPTPMDRIAEMEGLLEPVLEMQCGLLDFDTRNPNPQTVGACWTRAMTGGYTRGLFDPRCPNSLSEALERSESELEETDDPLVGLDEVLRENLSEIRASFGLDDVSVRILAFCIEAATDTSPLGYLLRLVDLRRQAKRRVAETLAAALALDISVVEEALEDDAPLFASGLLAWAENSEAEFSDRLEFADPKRFRMLASVRMPVEKLLASIVRHAPEAELALADFRHIPEAARLLEPYLKRVLETKRRGANVLLYGLPGTGKTQLVRALAAAAGGELYEVATEEGTERLKCWKTALSFLSKAEGAVIALDEAEDVFNGGLVAGFLSMEAPKRTNKGEINRLLEESAVPTFWITNSIGAIDPAMIRRFDLVLEVSVPDAVTRRRIVRESFGGRLSVSAEDRLVDVEMLSPAVLRRTAAVADLLGFAEGRLTEKEVVGAIDSTLRAQRFGRVPSESTVLTAFYDPAFVHADLHPTELAEGLRRAGGGRLCLYGPPGTGKSAYAAWVARELGVPLVRRQASDLMSMYVGETEERIARAFREAERAGALLLLDEADSFLRDRTLARVSWETTQVNEMLSQMEAYSGYFIATTNLIDTLDAASLRRFDLKAKFDYLTGGQAEALARRTLGAAGLEEDAEALGAIARLSQLTPGDFAAVRRQSAFRPLASAADLYERLRSEVELKTESRGAKPIGFC